MAMSKNFENAYMMDYLKYDKKKNMLLAHVNPNFYLIF